MAPIFEYRCPDGHITERYEFLSEAPSGVLCEHALWEGERRGLPCRKPAERIISAPALKHDGAYSHDEGRTT